MVKIASVEELKKIKESDYGFVIAVKEGTPTIHLTNCKAFLEKDALQNSQVPLNFHWFSTYSLAQKELGDLESCKICKPDST